MKLVIHILIVQKTEVGPLLVVVTKQRKRQNSLILTKQDVQALIFRIRETENSCTLKGSFLKFLSLASG